MKEIYKLYKRMLSVLTLIVLCCITFHGRAQEFIINHPTGDILSLHANVTYNSGDALLFEWTVNGTPTLDDDGIDSVFTYVPQDGDVVVCKITLVGTCKAVIPTYIIRLINNTHDRYLVAHQSDSLAILGEFHWLQDAVEFAYTQAGGAISGAIYPGCYTGTPSNDRYFIWATEDDPDMSDKGNEGGTGTFPVLVHGKDDNAFIPEGLNIKLASWGVTDPQYAFTITQQSMARHIIVNMSSLTLENIVLEGMNYKVSDASIDFGGNIVNGGVEVKTDNLSVIGYLTMENGAVIQYCYITDEGAGVKIMHGEFTMNGGEIRENKAGKYHAPSNLTADGYGGGVYILGDHAKFTLNDGIISGNLSTYEGGGVYVIEGGKFIMKGGAITGNMAIGGAGLEMHGNDNNKSLLFEMHGGAITGNIASAGYGDGAEVSTGGGMFLLGNENDQYLMFGGEISGNTAQVGGAVVMLFSAFNMSGGEISGNTAEGFEIMPGMVSGGGAVMVYSGELNMSGSAVISGNEALTGDGGGVYLLYSEDLGMTDATFTMTGGQIHDNHAPYGDGGGIFTGDHSYLDPANTSAYSNITIVDPASVNNNFSKETHKLPNNYDEFTNRVLMPFDGLLLDNDNINYHNPNNNIKTVCGGDSVVFEAIVKKVPGISYTYQWYLNGTILAGKTDSVYTRYNPADGDKVYCWVTSVTDCPDSIKTNIITIHVTPKPLAPDVSPSVFEICEGPVELEELPVGYTDITWYADENAKIKFASTTITKDTTLYFTQTVNGCESDPTTYTVIINPFMIVPPPALPDTMEVCETETATFVLTSLCADTNLLWYSDKGVTLIDPDQPLPVFNVFYYAGQKIGECASTTLDSVYIKKVNQFEIAPDIGTNFYFCTGAYLSDLNVRVNYPLTLNWFTAPGTTPLAGTHLLTNGTYYAQIAHEGTCDNNAFAEVEVQVGGTPPAPKDTTACEGITLGSIPLVGNGVIKWFKEATMTTPLSSDVVTEAGEIYYAAFTSSNCTYVAYKVMAKNCENTCDSLTSPLTMIGICSGEDVDYEIKSKYGDTNYSWSRSAVSGITPATNSGNTKYIQEKLYNSTSGTIKVTYKITLQNSGCTVTQDVTINVTPKKPIQATIIRKP